ncbi:MAG: YitT family protein [Firmicutes bacterium]|jgi:uncharacterized membrane-anchored protein YitT (DUF2179 family)|nr:YitT family protein [Bacillota bacterium]
MSPGCAGAFSSVMNAKSIKRQIMILLGNVILAICIQYFLLPPGFIVGGLTGVGNAFRLAFGLPISYVVAGLNVIFLVLARVFMGREFAANTIVCTIEYPIVLWAVERIYDVTGPLTDNFTLCLVFSAILFAFGISLIIGNGASSGGLDVIAVILNKKTGISVSRALNALELVALAAQVPNSQKEGILAGLLVIIVYTALLDRFLARGVSRIQLQISSPKYEEINEMIQTSSGHGSTMYSAIGGHEKNPTYIIQTVLDKKDLFRVKEQILKIDPTAFITVTNVSEVNGRGFTIEVDGK